MQFRRIYFWFQVIHVLSTIGNDISERIRILLINTFGYDFRELPEVGRVLYWRISKNEQVLQVQEYIKYVIQFKSNETYLIFTQTQESDISIYYWLGMSTSLDEKKAAARYAAFQYMLFVKYKNLVKKPLIEISISRELEAMESQSLRNTLNFINRSGKRKRNGYHIYLDTQYISQLLNLYVVRGVSTTRIKKVSSGTSWLTGDTCLVMDYGNKIDGLPSLCIYCGTNVSVKAKRRAEMLVEHLHTLYILSEERIPLYNFNNNNRNESKFKVFLEIMEDKKNYNPYDIDNSDDHLKDAASFVSDRDKAMKLFWIKHCTIKVEGTDKTENIVEKLEDDGKIEFTPAFQYGREKGIGFIFDSSSIAGLFVHINHDTTPEEKIAIIEMIEDHIEEKYSSNSRLSQVRIQESLYGYNIFDFCINLHYFPVYYHFEEQGLGQW